MTIAIGIIGQQDGQRPAIVFASDSQTTYGAPKSLDAQKLARVDFNDAQIMVAQAGSSQLADKVIEGMRKMAKGMNLENYETGAFVAQQAMREVRQQLLDIKKDFSFSYPDLKQVLLDNTVDLIVGYFFNREPYMFTLDIDRAMFFQVRTPFVAIGIGAYLGDFLLREYGKADSKFQFAWPMSIAVVEKVIDNVDGCGHPTRVAISYPLPQVIADQYIQAKKPYLKSLVSIIDQQEIGLMVDEVRAGELQGAEFQQEQMLKMLGNVWEKRRKIINQQLKETEDEMRRRGFQVVPQGK